MEPLVQLTATEEQTYYKLTQRQQERYWNIWQQRGRKKANSMAVLWRNGNRAGKAERTKRMSVVQENSIKHYLIEFFSEQRGEFTNDDAIASVRAEAPRFKPRSIRTAVSEAKAAGMVEIVRYERKQRGRTAYYKVKPEAFG